MLGLQNSAGIQCWVQGDTGYDDGVTRGGRGIFSTTAGRFKPVCHTC